LGFSNRTTVTRKDPESKPKAVVLMSGGLDSCVAAAIARNTHEVCALHADYGQRTERREAAAFQAQAEFFGAQRRLVVDLGYFQAIGGSSLTDRRIGVPDRAPEDREIPNTYVPFRNAHFLAVATSWAEVLGAGTIVIGAVSEDSSGYPDCRPEYYDRMNALIEVGTRPETRIRVDTPLIHMRKHEIVLKGIELEAPLDRSWSCYRLEDRACGICDSCRLRLAAFTQAGHTDPIAYAERYAEV
jgi:7-cyano-7-deazaguanine synthase